MHLSVKAEAILTFTSKGRQSHAGFLLHQHTRTIRAPAAARQVPASGALLLVGFVLLSLNTRAAFGQIGPLAPIAHFGSATVTVLGLLPPLCMGLFAPLAPLVRQ